MIFLQLEKSDVILSNSEERLLNLSFVTSRV